jgi:hypothetical protein
MISQSFLFIWFATLCLFTFYTYLSGYTLQHLSNTSILASSLGWTEPFTSSLLYCIFLVSLGPPNSLLFIPTIHISHVLPPLTTRLLNTAIQVNNTGAWHLMYNGHKCPPKKLPATKKKIPTFLWYLKLWSKSFCNIFLTHIIFLYVCFARFRNFFLVFCIMEKVNFFT